MSSISCEILGLQFKSCIINAAGPKCTDEKELHAIGRSESGAIVMKTITIKPREGNPEPTIWIFKNGTINSVGWRNKGLEYYISVIPELKKYGKPIIASVGGFSSKEYTDVAREISQAGTDLIEVNLSCPNISNFPPPAYSHKIAAKILNKVGRLLKYLVTQAYNS
jgi:dihydroorotate dehydrogenase (fumarate)